MIKTEVATEQRAGSKMTNYEHYVLCAKVILAGRKVLELAGHDYKFIPEYTKYAQYNLKL